MNFYFFSVAVLLCVGYPSGSSGTSSYIRIGCFKDRYRPRALPELLANYRGTLDWHNLKKVVEDCASKAYLRNYLYFSIQFYGECWSGKNAPLTYDQYGTSSNCYFDVGKQLTNVVYRLVGDEKECLDYATLTSANRSSSYSLPAAGSSASCDRDLTPQWYRFLPPAGDQMASSYVPPRKCATELSGWLASIQPNMTDGIVNGKVCFSFELEECAVSEKIQVRNCGRFYVYKLKPTKHCPLRFCGQH